MAQNHLENHIVICGWKDRMNKFFEAIVAENSADILTSITVAANIDAEELELFKQNHPEYSGVFFVRGNHYQEATLKKANISNAKKIFILADERNDDSIIGADSLIVLTAMTIRAITSSVPIVAELTDKKFEKYLDNAQVDEIIYSNEYSSALLASSLQQVGLTKAVNDLLVSHKTGKLLIADIPSNLTQATFKTLQEHFLHKEGSIVIGVLENVGNLLNRKQEAIRLAQKTASVRALIENLNAAKNIENNRPYILPDDNYIIPENSLVIMITSHNSFLNTGFVT